MSAWDDSKDLDCIELTNKIAFSRSRRMLHFLRLIYEREAQILSESEKIPANDSVKNPQDSN